MAADDRHNYEYSIDLSGPTAPARVIRVVGKNKKVLEIGAGPGSITRHLVADGKCDVTALEIDEKAIKKLREYVDKIYSADLNDEKWPEVLANEGPFDVVVAADVLEHLYDPWTTLKLMKSLLAEDGYIVLSLPHVGHGAISACLLAEDFDYRDWGLLDRTHIRFFGLKNMQALIEQADMTIDHAEFVLTEPKDTEFEAQWSSLSVELRKALLENPFGSVYQVVIKCVSSTSTSNKVNLMSLPGGGVVAQSSFKRLGKKYLPEFIKAPLRRLLF